MFEIFDGTSCIFFVRKWLIFLGNGFFGGFEVTLGMSLIESFEAFGRVVAGEGIFFIGFGRGVDTCLFE